MFQKKEIIGIPNILVHERRIRYYKTPLVLGIPVEREDSVHGYSRLSRFRIHVIHVTHLFGHNGVPPKPHRIMKCYKNHISSTLTFLLMGQDGYPFNGSHPPIKGFSFITDVSLIDV